MRNFSELTHTYLSSIQEKLRAIDLQVRVDSFTLVMYLSLPMLHKFYIHKKKKVIRD